MTWFTRRRLAILAAASFVIGVIEFMPAHFFEERINKALPAPWHLTTSGTVWDGFGVLQTAGSDLLAIPLTWKFDALALARARLAWKITPDSIPLSGSVNVGVGWQSLEFREAALAMDAEILQHAVPILAIFAPSGKVRISTTQDTGFNADFGDDVRFTGDAELQAENFGLRPYGPQPLGTYQIKFTGRDTNVDYVVGPSNGALKVEGGGSIQTAAPRQIGYAGFITAAPTLNDTLLSQIRTMGQPGADGRVRIDWKARW